MRARPLIGWGVFLLLVVIIVSQLPSGLGGFYLIKGKRLSIFGDHLAAVQAYQQSINSDPTFARAYVELGSSYLVLEKYVEAEAAFKQAATIDDDSCASCGLGMAYQFQGRDEEAAKALKRAISLNPNDICPHDALGRMYYARGRYAESIEAFQQRIKLRPTAVSYHFLGNAYHFTGKLDDALAAYQKAIHLSPKYEEAYIELGKVYDRLGCHVDAIDSYKRALKIQPDDVMAHVGLGLSELKHGNKNAAVRQYRVLVDLDPEAAERLLREINAQQARRVTGSGQNGVGRVHGVDARNFERR